MFAVVCCVLVVASTVAKSNDEKPAYFDERCNGRANEVFIAPNEIRFGQMVSCGRSCRCSALQESADHSAFACFSKNVQQICSSVGVCVCIGGYFRNEDGRCVVPENCQNEKNHIPPAIANIFTPSNQLNDNPAPRRRIGADSSSKNLNGKSNLHGHDGEYESHGSSNVASFGQNGGAKSHGSNNVGASRGKNVGTHGHDADSSHGQFAASSNANNGDFSQGHVSSSQGHVSGSSQKHISSFHSQNDEAPRGFSATSFKKFGGGSSVEEVNIIPSPNGINIVSSSRRFSIKPSSLSSDHHFMKPSSSSSDHHFAKSSHQSGAGSSKKNSDTDSSSRLPQRIGFLTSSHGVKIISLSHDFDPDSSRRFKTGPDFEGFDSDSSKLFEIDSSDDFGKDSSKRFGTDSSSPRIIFITPKRFGTDSTSKNFGNDENSFSKFGAEKSRSRFGQDSSRRRFGLDSSSSLFDDEDDSSSSLFDDEDSSFSLFDDHSSSSLFGRKSSSLFGRHPSRRRFRFRNSKPEEIVVELDKKDE